MMFKHVRGPWFDRKFFCHNICYNTLNFAFQNACVILQEIEHASGEKKV